MTPVRRSLRIASPFSTRSPHSESFDERPRKLLRVSKGAAVMPESGVSVGGDDEAVAASPTAVDGAAALTVFGAGEELGGAGSRTHATSARRAASIRLLIAITIGLPNARAKLQRDQIRVTPKALQFKRPFVSFSVRYTAWS